MNNLIYCLFYFACYLTAVSYGFLYVLSLYVERIGGKPTDVGFTLALAGVSTLVCVLFSEKLARLFTPIMTCAIGALLCSVGMFFIFRMHQINEWFYLCGIFIGGGWSLYYSASPMAQNQLVPDEKRGKHVSFLSAFIVLGTSTAPIFMVFLSKTISISIQTIYEFSYFISILSCILFFITHLFTQNRINIAVKTQTPAVNNSMLKHFKHIIQLEAIYPIIMVFLGACVLTSMLNFQFFYAQSRHLSFQIYYISYVISVVSCRFILGKKITIESIRQTPLLLFFMFFGIVLLFVNSGSNILYALSAAMIGVSYGMVYPIIKTYAINTSPHSSRNFVVSLFTLSYFIGVYVFPLLGSYLIQTFSFNYLLWLLIIIVIADGTIGYLRGIAMSFSKEKITSTVGQK